MPQKDSFFLFFPSLINLILVLLRVFKPSSHTYKIFFDLTNVCPTCGSNPQHVAQVGLAW